MSAAPEILFPAGFDSGPVHSGVAWLDGRRADAWKRFRAGGIPHRRVEEWKYSDLRNALESAPAPATTTAEFADPFVGIKCEQLLISDGCLISMNSGKPLPRGVDVLDLAALRSDAPDWVKAHLGHVLKLGTVGQASLALMQGGIALRITAEVATPLYLRFQQQEHAVHARVLIVVEQGASVCLLESHAASEGLTNLGVEAVLAPNARLTHLRLSDAAPDAISIEEIGIRVGRDATYRGHFAQAGARLARFELTIALEDEGAEAELTGAAALGGKRHSDVTTHIIHATANTASRQLFKYVAGGHSRAIYQGKITVAKGADGSDSLQTAKAIVIGERAEADLKPELEILADDVKCAHGAAVGDLDTDSLFYLRARGIPENEARGLLLRGFLEEAVTEIDDDLRGAMWRFIERGLSQAAEVPQ